MGAALLDPGDIEGLVAFRRHLHRHPEISGAEAGTAARVAAMLRASGADDVVEAIGGHGIAGIFEGRAPGRTVMIRAELDALPIHEQSGLPWRSGADGAGHLCGHDGHMTILAALALGLGRARPARGRAILLFQPAEETGQGAAAVLADPGFAAIRPDMVLALHNMPGLPLGRVALRAGPVNCASRGMRLRLRGRTAHASQPETGISPAPALAALMTELPALSRGDALDGAFRLVTVTHARLGAPSFGIAPGEAELCATLRCLTDGAMASLVAATMACVTARADAAGLAAETDWHDVFAHCENHPDATALLSRAALSAGAEIDATAMPVRWSEDFGRFATIAPSALFGLGAGIEQAHLHNPDYDFPDALIEPGAAIFMGALREILG